VALVLAAVGTYGVMTFMVAQRTREIGLRMALAGAALRRAAPGARPGHEHGRAGAVLGSIGAFFVSQAMRSLLPGLGALSTLAFAGVAVALLAAAFLACLVPARRAASVDPMVALRQV
jgi:putative ABC transport system permease protein